MAVLNDVKIEDNASFSSRLVKIRARRTRFVDCVDEFVTEKTLISTIGKIEDGSSMLDDFQIGD